jgi:hypothetical protein
MLLTPPFGEVDIAKRWRVGPRNNDGSADQANSRNATTINVDARISLSAASGTLGAI